MCLSCMVQLGRSMEGISGKENIKKIFNLQPMADALDTTIEALRGLSQYNSTILHTHDNKKIELNYEQITEITNNALVVLVTGIDTQIDIWSIQWETDYVVKTLN